ncbi:MAG: glutamine--fructose-6-phosphate transaminase (isomerizing) [Patescibacteria group bacterium]|jgi:glucosamine--fructose-6-phosphate aminotransferase (isomerizing)
MCGIFAYRGGKSAPALLLTGLQRLEYRGYDSWGFAVTDGSNISVEKAIGPIGQKNSLSLPAHTHSGIAHTRWATHGSVSEKNSHPHFSTDKSFVLAQNGIVENCGELKINLQKKGYKFITETDTEVIVRLIESIVVSVKVSLPHAARLAAQRLLGRNTFIIIDRKGQITAVRNGSPLVVGRNSKTSDLFLSSDTLSFAEEADELLVIDNGQIVTVENNGKIEVASTGSGKPVSVRFEKLHLKKNTIDREGYPHFMVKEIHESPVVMRQLTLQPQEKYRELGAVIRNARTVYTIGSGTAGVAASQIAFYLRTYAHINAISLIGADARDYYQFFSEGDVLIAPSQSGETADVLEVLEYAKKQGVKIASFVNMPGSTMTRISDFPFLSEAGPEICVMSTKVFVSQLTWGYLLAKSAAGKYQSAVQTIKSSADSIQKLLESTAWHKNIEKVAQRLEKCSDIFLLGKYQNLNIVKEGMVKLIEGSYKHAHAIPAGDLKHYAITLMEKNVPVITVLSNDTTKEEVLNAVHQVKARGATVIGIAPFSDGLFDAHIPMPDCGELSAVANIIPLQLVAYHVAVLLGNDVDHPRNIAKSVTVK